MSNFNFYNIKIPKIFKIIQSKLKIENEVTIIKTQLNNHKYKITFISLLLFYPFYYPYFYNGYKALIYNISNRFYSSAKNNSEIYNLLTSVIKQIFSDSLTDETVKQNAIIFLLDILKNKDILKSLKELLIEALNDEKIKSAILDILLICTKKALSDENLKAELKAYILEILKDQLIKDQITETLQDIVSQEIIKNTIAELFIKVLQDPDLQHELTALLKNSMYDIIIDNETNEKFNIFFYNFLNNNKNINEESILNLIIKKLVNKNSNESSKLENILNKFSK